MFHHKPKREMVSIKNLVDADERYNQKYAQEIKERKKEKSVAVSDFMKKLSNLVSGTWELKATDEKDTYIYHTGDHFQVNDLVKLSAAGMNVKSRSATTKDQKSTTVYVISEFDSKKFDKFYKKEMLAEYQRQYSVGKLTSVEYDEKKQQLFAVEFATYGVLTDRELEQFLAPEQSRGTSDSSISWYSKMLGR